MALFGWAAGLFSAKAKLDAWTLAHMKEIQLFMWTVKLIVGLTCVGLAIAKNYGFIDVHISFLEPEDGSEISFYETRLHEKSITVVSLLGVGIALLLPVIFPPVPKSESDANALESLVDKLVPGIRGADDSGASTEQSSSAAKPVDRVEGRTEATPALTSDAAASDASAGQAGLRQRRQGAAAQET